MMGKIVKIIFLRFVFGALLIEDNCVAITVYHKGN